MPKSTSQTSPRLALNTFLLLLVVSEKGLFGRSDQVGFRNHAVGIITNNSVVALAILLMHGLFDTPEGHVGLRTLRDREESQHALMSEEELYDRIQTEASQHIPFDIADVNLSHQLLEANENQMDVLVAVKKDKILNDTNVLAQAGKTPVVVDIDAFALQNSFEVNYDPDPSQVAALLNIGASVMNINIVRAGRRFLRATSRWAATSIRTRLQKELHLSFEDAEKLKMGGTLAGVTDEQRSARFFVRVDVLILEIQKTFDFFRAMGQRREHPPDFRRRGRRVFPAAGPSEGGVRHAGGGALSVSKDQYRHRASRREPDPRAGAVPGGGGGPGAEEFDTP